MLNRFSKSLVSVLMIAACVAGLTAMFVEARAVREGSSSPLPQGTGDLAKVSETWAKEWGAKNLEAVVALYAEDAVFMPAQGSRVAGRTAIRQLFAGALAAQSSDLRIHSRGTEQSGHLAYDSGEYEEISTVGGVKRSGRGNYLVVFRREGKNQWRIIQHMWTDFSAPK